jgi:predicted small secreted protein
MMKKIGMGLLASLLASLVLTGCNTVEGFGKDVKKVGEKVEGAAAKK